MRDRGEQNCKCKTRSFSIPYKVKLRLLPNSRSFLADQKARNAIDGAKNLLMPNSRSFLANQKARNAIDRAENLLTKDR